MVSEGYDGPLVVLREGCELKARLLGERPPALACTTRRV